MFRLLTHLLGKPFEECKSCETLKQQLEFERAEKKELTKTLLDIIHPSTSVQNSSNSSESIPVVSTSGLWARKRAALEERDRMAAATARLSKNLAKPDNPIQGEIEKLESNLGIIEEAKEG